MSDASTGPSRALPETAATGGPPGQAIPVFVISLVRATERRQAITRHLAGLSVAFTLIDAVDGQAMSEAERSALCAPGRTFAPGEIGCYLSHIEVYRRIVAQGTPTALVLEDDTRLHPAVVPLLRAGLSRQSFDSFDYCFLDSWSYGTSTAGETRAYIDLSRLEALAGPFRIGPIAPPPLGAHAYLITAAAAARRLEHALPIREAIDRYTQLPYPIRFMSMYEPKGAWIDPAGQRTSQTKVSGTRNPRPWHVRLSVWRPWYALWRWFHPDMRAARRAVPELMQQGILDANGRWEPLPPTPEGGGPMPGRMHRPPPTAAWGAAQ